jgi:hypothetical protein
MKYLILWLLILTSPISLAASPLIECNSCSYNRIKTKVIQSAGIKPLSTHYVIDFSNQSLKYFKAKIDDENGVYEVSQLSIDSNINDAINDFFSARSSLQQMLTNDPNLISNLINDGHVPVSNFNVPLLTNFYTLDIASISTGACTASDKGIYDFLSTSSFRTNTFNAMKTYYPTAQSFFNTWNRFVAASNASVGVLSVEGGWFALPQTINFPDGGRADVIVSSDGNSFNVLDGSAYDCDNNEIPTTAGEFQGNFNFSTNDGYDAFSEYGASFGVTFSAPVCRMEFLMTSCVKKSSGRYECRLQCN